MKKKNAFRGAYIALLLAFLYAPIAVLIIYSFNASKSRGKWGGFTLDWYKSLLDNPEIINALYTTLTVAALAALISTVLGTLAAVGIHAMRRRPQSAMLTVSYLPMITPDIVMGVSLMILFVALHMRLDFTTMLLAHITFDTPYVIFSVMPRLKRMNPHMYEAALDLGATPLYAMRTVILPEIAPGIITGALLSFTMSLDDFVVSFFTSNVPNLSVLVYSMARKGVTPSINALSTVMFVVILALLMIVNKRADLETI